MTRRTTARARPASRRGVRAPVAPRLGARSRPTLNPTVSCLPARDPIARLTLPPRPPSSFLPGGKLPDTVTNPEWAKATADMQKAWPREGAPDRPVKLNPMFGK